MSLESIRAHLETVREEIATAAYDELRRAVDEGETKRPDLEKRLTRARGAVERALAALGESDEDA